MTSLHPSRRGRVQGIVEERQLHRLGWIAIVLLVCRCALAQGGAPERQDQVTTLHSTARLVVVPALVRDHAGQVVAGLDAGSFRLTDNGVEQTLTVEPPEAESTDVVILLQTGGDAQRAFPYYRDVGPMVEPMMGKSPHRVALVTFDSKVEQIWNFPPRGEGITYAFSHPLAGDGGAALLDAIDFAVKMLDEQVASRRMIVLFSQAYDVGSKVSAEAVVKRLGESNTAIYTLSLVASKKGGGIAMQSGAEAGTALGAALVAMHADTAGEIAALSGGEHLNFRNKHELETGLGLLGKHVPNRYILSFRPTSNEPGFHVMAIEARDKKGALQVDARSGYWSK